MNKNMRTFLEPVVEIAPKTLVDFSDMKLLVATGLAGDIAHRKSGNKCGGWATSKSKTVSIPLGKADFTGYRYLIFSLYSVHGAGEKITLSLMNDAENGYETVITVDTDGWNNYALDLCQMAGVGAPTGRNAIAELRLNGAFVKEPILYLDNFFLSESANPFYVTMPELKGTAVYHRNGGYAIVDRRRCPNSPDGTTVQPFEEKENLWVPVAPVAVAFGHKVMADTKNGTLTFLYRRVQYEFTIGSDIVVIDKTKKRLAFSVRGCKGVVCLPADFLRQFFHWRFVREDKGLILFSNRKDFLKGHEETLNALTLSAVLDPISGDKLAEKVKKCGNTRSRLLLSSEQWSEKKKQAKEDPQCKALLTLLKEAYGTKSVAFKEPLNPKEVDGDIFASATAKNILAFSVLYRLTGDKKYALRVLEDAQKLNRTPWGNSPSVWGNTAMSLACAYDWCRTAYDDGQRASMEIGMKKQGLNRGIQYMNGTLPKWKSASGDEAIACAGMTALALVLAPVYPESCVKVLDYSAKCVENCLKQVIAGTEGTSCRQPEQFMNGLAFLQTAYESVNGGDFGISRLPGFEKLISNLSASETANGALTEGVNAYWQEDMAFRMASLLGNKDFAWLRRQKILSEKVSVSPMDLAFFTSVKDGNTPVRPLDVAGAHAVVIRSGYGKKDAVVKITTGNDKSVPGSIIAEIAGISLFRPFGSEETPDKLKNSLYLQNGFYTESAVTGVIPEGRIAGTKFTEDSGATLLDLTACGEYKKALRGIMLDDDRTALTVHDDILFDGNSQLCWNLLTDATVSGKNRNHNLILEKDGVRVSVKLSGFGQNVNVTPVGTTGYTAITVLFENVHRVKLTLNAREVVEENQ